jgi:hypothetical protein
MGCVWAIVKGIFLAGSFPEMRATVAAFDRKILSLGLLKFVLKTQNLMQKRLKEGFGHWVNEIGQSFFNVFLQA